MSIFLFGLFKLLNCAGVMWNLFKFVNCVVTHLLKWCCLYLEEKYLIFFNVNLQLLGVNNNFSLLSGEPKTMTSMPTVNCGSTNRREQDKLKVISSCHIGET